MSPDVRGSGTGADRGLPEASLNGKAVDDGAVRAGEDATATLPSASKTGDATQADALATVRPNPTAGTALAPFTLGAPARLRAAVYDALGREVARVADAEMEAGAHALRVTPGAWAPGVYLLSVRVESEGGAAGAYLRRFTLAR